MHHCPRGYLKHSLTTSKLVLLRSCHCPFSTCILLGWRCHNSTLIGEHSSHSVCIVYLHPLQDQQQIFTSFFRGLSFQNASCLRAVTTTLTIACQGKLSAESFIGNLNLVATTLAHICSIPLLRQALGKMQKCLITSLCHMIFYCGYGHCKHSYCYGRPANNSGRCSHVIE